MVMEFYTCGLYSYRFIHWTMRVLDADSADLYQFDLRTNQQRLRAVSGGLTGAIASTISEECLILGLANGTFMTIAEGTMGTEQCGNGLLDIPISVPITREIKRLTFNYTYLKVSTTPELSTGGPPEAIAVNELGMYYISSIEEVNFVPYIGSVGTQATTLPVDPSMLSTVVGLVGTSPGLQPLPTRQFPLDHY